jgi:amidophosphoribosyltransferase
MPSASELVAHERSEEDVQRQLGCDWLVYQDIEDLEWAVAEGNDSLTSFDASCFTGDYVTGIDADYFERLQHARSDLAKRARRLAG